MLIIRDNAVVVVPQKLIEDRRIPASERSVLLTIALADKGNGITIDDLCEFEGRTKRTIRKYLKHLIECGYIEKTDTGYEANI